MKALLRRLEIVEFAFRAALGCEFRQQALEALEDGNGVRNFVSAR